MVFLGFLGQSLLDKLLGMNLMFEGLIGPCMVEGADLFLLKRLKTTWIDYGNDWGDLRTSCPRWCPGVNASSRWGLQAGIES